MYLSLLGWEGARKRLKTRLTRSPRRADKEPETNRRCENLGKIVVFWHVKSCVKVSRDRCGDPLEGQNRQARSCFGRFGAPLFACLFGGVEPAAGPKIAKTFRFCRFRVWWRFWATLFSGVVVPKKGLQRFAKKFCIRRKVLLPRRRRSSFTVFFWHKKFCSSYPFRACWGRFPGILQSESSERKSRVGARRGFLILRSRILRETGTNFVTHFVTNFVTNWPEIAPNFFRPFSLPQRIHAKSTPPLGPTSTPILENVFSVVSLGARHWSASLLLDASMSMLTNENV